MHYNGFNGNVATVGKAIPGVEIIIINDNNESCQPFEVGEICAKGDNIMLGYYKDKESTKKAFFNEYLRTGDIGYFDNKGYLYIVGRKKNVIISGGINIYPEEIEEVLLNSCPSIKEIKAYPLPDKTLGEVVGLMIVKNSLDKITKSEILKICLQKFSLNKQPKEIHFVEKISKTPNGKIIRM